MKKQKFIVPEIFSFVLSDSSRATADSGVNLIISDAKLFDQLFSISFASPYPYGMRAARIIQLYCEKETSLLKPHINEVVERIPDCKISGVKRCYLKVLSEFVDLKTIKEPGILAGICFDWLMSLNEDTAVRTFCMEILYKMTAIEPDLKQELVSSIEFHFDDSSTGFRNRAKKILKKLGKKDFREEEN
jgi:hypothetical protein